MESTQPTTEAYPVYEAQVIPPPPQTMNRPSHYPLARMKPGDAFKVSKRQVRVLRAMISNLRVHAGMDFRIRKVDDDTYECVFCGDYECNS